MLIVQPRTYIFHFKRIHKKERGSFSGCDVKNGETKKNFMSQTGSIPYKKLLGAKMISYEV